MILNSELLKKIFDDLTAKQEGFIENKIDGMKEEEALHLVESTTELFLQVAKKWNDEPNDLLDGKTPSEVFSNLSDAEFAEFVRVFFMSEATAINDIYADLFKAHQDTLFEVADGLFKEKLEQIVNGDDPEKFDYANFEVAMEIIITVFEYDKTRYLKNIIDSFACVESDDDVWKAEMYMDMIFMHGEYAIPAVKSVLEDRISFSYSDEYLMAVIGRIGGNAKEKDNELYCILRTFFKTTKAKGYAALCIGDFGDSRGIALLRTYLENNISVMEEADVMDMLAAIQQLGGDISDFM